MLDSDLRIVYANPAFCRLFGYPVGRLLGQHALMLAPERRQQTALKYWADVRNGRSEPLLGIGFRANGSELEIEVSGTVLDLQGKRFLVFAARDVTERQRQGRQAAALAQAATSVATSDSIEAVLEAISECALAGTRALAKSDWPYQPYSRPEVLDEAKWPVIADRARCRTGRYGAVPPTHARALRRAATCGRYRKSGSGPILEDGLRSAAAHAPLHPLRLPPAPRLPGG
jgi:PAS domain S-box-containing protein